MYILYNIEGNLNKTLLKISYNIYFHMSDHQRDMLKRDIQYKPSQKDYILQRIFGILYQIDTHYNAQNNLIKG